MNLAKLKKQLQSYGIGKTDSGVYLKSLELGPSTIAELAKVLGQNRVTVHSAVERLLEKGYLTQTKKGKRRLIVPADPKVFTKILEKKELEVKQMSDDLESIVSSLSVYNETERFQPSIRVYDGVQGFLQMTEETLEAKTDLLILNNSVKRFSEMFGPGKFEKWLEKKAKKGILTKLLLPPGSALEKIQKKKHLLNIAMKTVPSSENTSSAMFIWDHTAALTSFKQGRMSTTIIENQDIINMLRMTHELIWSKAAGRYKENTSS